MRTGSSQRFLERGRADAWKAPADAALGSDKKTLTLGGEDFQILFLGRSHTGGDIAVWLPKEKILFLSVIYLNRVFTAMRSAYPSEWLKARTVPYHRAYAS